MYFDQLLGAECIKKLIEILPFIMHQLAILYVDKIVEMSWFNCTKSLTLLCFVFKAIAGPFFKNNFVTLKGPNKNYRNYKSYIFYLTHFFRGKPTKLLNDSLTKFRVKCFKWNILKYLQNFLFQKFFKSSSFFALKCIKVKSRVKR